MKSTNKRRGYLTEQEFIVSDNIQTLHGLLCELSSQMVTAYTKKEIDTDTVGILTDVQIVEGIENGKVGFGRRFGGGNAASKKAEETMTVAYKDGLFRVFLNDTELTDLYEFLMLKDGDKLVLIRIIMLAGSIFPYLI